MYVTDLTGKSELLTDFNLLKWNKRVNSQRIIEFEIHPTERNVHAINLVENESIINVFDEEYVIKDCSTRAVGRSYVKSVMAIKKFYVDLLGKQQPNVFNGSMTFLAALGFVFDGTEYTPVVSDGVFYAQSFEGLGNTNRLSILQTVIERYGAEFVVEGTRVYFYAEIGTRTDEIFRYGHNIRAFEMSYNTNDLATKISGTGANIGTDEAPVYLTATYTSPNHTRYGIIEAEPINDERYTTTGTLLTALQNSLIDEPELSVQLDVAVLAKQGIENLNEGDYIHLIYEPVNDLELYVRIVEINEYYDKNLQLVDSDITLANKRDTLTVSLADQIKHRVDEVKKEVVTIVQQSANGKNKNFRGVTKPTGGSLNDIWYRPVGAGEVEMWIHDGIDFVKTASSADNLGGTLNAAQLNVINLNANSIAGGSLDLAKGISVKNGANEVLKVADNEVIMNVDTLKVNAKDVATTEYVNVATTTSLNDLAETLNITISDGLMDKIGAEQFNEFLENNFGQFQLVNTKMSEFEQQATGFSLSITDIESITDNLQSFTNSVRSYMDFTSEDMLVIGKTDSPFRIQITNTQINFLNGADTIAYLNGSKLFITDAEITSSIIIGSHLLESGNSGTLVKWAGD